MKSLHMIEQALALTLLHSLWQGLALALLAAMAFWLLGPRRPAARHGLGLVLLAAMVAVPVCTFSLVLNAPPAADVEMLAVEMFTQEFTVSPAAGTVVPPFAPPLALLPWAWAAGVAFMLIRLMGGWWAIDVLARQVHDPLPPALRARLHVLRRAMGIRREVAVRVLRTVALPCSARLWRPIIWLPAAMLTRLPPEQIEALIAHELAHIRRLDWVWNGLQCVIEALLFYHPAAWWLGRRIRQEREHACDDLAVAAGSEALVLAEALSALEDLRPVYQSHCRSHYRLTLSANGGSLMQRITRLLSPATGARPGWGAPAALCALFFSGILIAGQVDLVPLSKTNDAALEQPAPSPAPVLPNAPIAPNAPVPPVPPKASPPGPSAPAVPPSPAPRAAGAVQLASAAVKAVAPVPPVPPIAPVPAPHPAPAAVAAPAVAPSPAPAPTPDVDTSLAPALAETPTAPPAPSRAVASGENPSTPTVPRPDFAGVKQVGISISQLKMLDADTVSVSLLLKDAQSDMIVSQPRIITKLGKKATITMSTGVPAGGGRFNSIVALGVTCLFTKATDANDDDVISYRCETTEGTMGYAVVSGTMQVKFLDEYFRR